MFDSVEDTDFYKRNDVQEFTRNYIIPIFLQRNKEVFYYTVFELKTWMPTLGRMFSGSYSTNIWFQEFGAVLFTKHILYSIAFNDLETLKIFKKYKIGFESNLDSNTGTPLCIAVKYTSLKIFRYLIENFDFDPHEMCTSKMTCISFKNDPLVKSPFLCAVCNNKIATIGYLNEVHNMKHDSRTEKINALAIASKYSDPSTLEYLIKRLNFDPSKLLKRFNRNAFFIAMDSNVNRTAKLRLLNEINPDLKNSMDILNRTALTVACQDKIAQSDENLLKFLIDELHMNPSNERLYCIEKLPNMTYKCVVKTHWGQICHKEIEK